MGAIRAVSTVAPVGERAGIISAFYVVAYLALALPAMVAGLLVPELGIESTVRVFGLAVGGLALTAAVGTRRRVPGARRARRSLLRRDGQIRRGANGGAMQSKLLPPIQLGCRSRLEEVLSEDVVFHSPVRDYGGQADVAHILLMIGTILDGLNARRELGADGITVTIIAASHHGHRLEGVLEEGYDQLGRVQHATLLLRPLSALREAINGMGAALERLRLPSSR